MLREDSFASFVSCKDNTSNVWSKKTLQRVASETPWTRYAILQRALQDLYSSVLLLNKMHYPGALTDGVDVFGINSFHIFLMRAIKIAREFVPPRLVKQTETWEYLQSSSVVLQHLFICISVFVRSSFYLCVISLQAVEFTPQQMEDSALTWIIFQWPADDAAIKTMKPDSWTAFKLLMRVWGFHKINWFFN